MKRIEFTTDFATRKKGEILECDSMLASQLVHEEKVAKYSTATDSLPNPSKSKTKKTEE